MNQQNQPKNGGEGAVNFDAGIVRESAAVEQQAVSAAQSPESPVVTMHVAPPNKEAVIIKADEEVAADTRVNELGVVLMVTLNMARPIMAGLKELKNVNIEQAGVSESFNFYNPFRRANKEQQTGEGVIRKAFAQIAVLANAVMNKEVIYLGAPELMGDKVRAIASQLAYNVESKFPLKPTQFVLNVDVDGDTDAGEEPTQQKIFFGDLFRVETWDSSSEEGGVASRNIYLNLIIEAAAFYDSKEPHQFVEQAFKVIQNTLTHHELDIPAYFAVSFDVASFGNEDVRDLVNILIDPDEGAYSLISLGHVMLGNERSWVSPEDATKLFGVGSDALLFKALFDEEEDELEEEEEDDEDGEEGDDDDELLEDDDEDDEDGE